MSRLLRTSDAGALRKASRTASRDIGHIAVLDASDGVVSRRNPFNLDGRGLRFLPAGAGYRFELTTGGYSPELAEGGSPITGLKDDDTSEQALPFAFPFYGTSYDRLFVNSDGNLTFTAPDTATSDRGVGRMTSGPPRISPFFLDLDPSLAPDSVRISRTLTRFTVSWVRVPEYRNVGFGPPNTVQVSLFSDGRIEFAWQSVASSSAVVGIAPGETRNGSSLVSFTRDPSRTFPGAVLERFSSTEDVDIVFAAQKFYETHDDSYDFLVVYNNLGIQAAPGAVAFEVSVRNQRRGIGDALVDNGREYGSPRRLQAVLNLGPLSQYPTDPDAVVPARFLSRDTPLTILGHEAGHLWLAFASVRDPLDPEARPMLGRQTAHWAFTFNSEASLLEGNRIRDNGPEATPRFTTTGTVEGFAPLDQYLMGLRPPAEVPPTFYVSQASIGTAGRPPQSNVFFDGVRRDVTVEDVIAAEGRLIPDHTVSQRRFRFAFLLITAEGSDPTPGELAQLDRYRAGFEPFFARVTDGRAFADTTLRAGLRLSAAPAAGVVQGSQVTATVELPAARAIETNVLLRTENGAAGVPASVRIPAGAVRAAFALNGIRSGVDELRAEAGDNQFAPAHARIQVLPAAGDLRLLVVAGDRQPAPAAGAISVTVKVADANHLPYAGLAVSASVASGGGAVQPASAVSDADGFVRFQWTPGPGDLKELLFRLASAPSVTATAVALGRPVIGENGVVNAASGAVGLVPGGVATVAGFNFAAAATAADPILRESLAGVSVAAGGIPCTILFVNDRQVNFLVPSNLPLGRTQVTVAVERAGVRETSAPVSVPVLAVQPGVFGARAAGSAVEIYATGLGQAQPEVFIGGRAAGLLYSGPAPGSPGVHQINAAVPADLASAPHPVTVRAGGVTSNAVEVVLTR